MLFDVSEAESRIGYAFKNKELLRQAFTHSSYSNEKHVSSNERLEFLGDSILNFVIAEILYKQYPDFQEGDLTRIRASIVSAPELHAASQNLNLNELMLLGEGEKKNDSLSSNITADLFEAVTAAIYLDCGIGAAAKFIKQALKKQIGESYSSKSQDSKSQLSELAQKKFKANVSYVTLNQEGAAHTPRFTIAAVIKGITYQSATAENKKAAQQQAAKNAIDSINNTKPNNNTNNHGKKPNNKPNSNTINHGIKQNNKPNNNNSRTNNDTKTNVNIDKLIKQHAKKNFNKKQKNQKQNNKQV